MAPAMRKTCTVLVFGLLLSSPAQAGFKISGSVFRMDDLESAQSKASARGKPMSFILSDESTTCGLASASSLAMINSFRSRTIMVYVNSKNSDERQEIPRLVKEAFASAESGKYIPKTVIVDPQMEKVISVVPYARGREQDKHLRRARKDMSAAKKSAKALVKPRTRSVQQTAPAALRTWTSRSGSEVKATLVNASGGYLVLKKEDGSRLRIQKSKLSEEDQKYLASLNP